MLAGMLTAVMVVTALPGSAFAEEITGDPVNESVEAVQEVDTETAASEIESTEAAAVTEETAETTEASETVEETTETVSEEPDTEELTETEEVSESVSDEESSEEIAEADAEETGLVSVASEYTVNISDDMEHDQYTIKPSECVIKGGDNRYYVEKNVGYIKVILTLDPDYELDGDITATISGEAAVVSVGTVTYDDGGRTVTISHDESQRAIDGDVVISVNVKRIVYEHEIVLHRNTKFIGLAEGCTDNVSYDDKDGIIYIEKNSSINTVAAFEIEPPYNNDGVIMYVYEAGDTESIYEEDFPDCVCSVDEEYMYNNLRIEVYNYRATIPVSIENATLKWANNPFTIDKDLTDGCIKTKYTGFYLKVEPEEGCKNPKVVLEFGSEKKTLTEDVIGSGVYYIDGENLYVYDDGKSLTGITVTAENENKVETVINLKGATVDRNTGVATITQDPGTAVSYAVSVNSGGDLSAVLNSEVSIAESGSNISASIDADKKLLKITTGESVLADPGTYTLQFKKGSKKVCPDVKLVVNDKPKQFAAPTVKVTAATDIGFILSLGLPKGISDENYSNIFYVIEAKATGECSENMKPEFKAVIGGAEISYDLKLANKDNPVLGDGAAQKYDIKVTLVQIKDDAKYLNESRSFADDVTLINPGTAKELKKQSTKDPYYENKLSLVKKTTTITKGQKNVLLATAKFSKNTSYCRLTRASLYDESGSSCGDILDITEDGQGIKLTKSNKLSPGKYTLVAYPELPEGSYVAATLSITVKSRVEDITVKVPSHTIYKKGNKAATMKLSAVVTGSTDYIGKVVKPANSKLVWEVDGNETIKKYVTCKNGKITVAKGYTLSADPDENVFDVIVRAADLGEDGASESAGTFLITSESVTPASMYIGAVEGAARNPESHLSSNLDSKELVIKDEKGNTLDLSGMTVTVSPKTGLKVNSYDHKVSVDKTGTYTIKATSNDGSKKSISRKFVVASAPLDAEQPYNVAYQYMNNGGTTKMLDITEGRAEATGVSMIMVWAEPKVTAPANSDDIADVKVSVSVRNGKKIKISSAGEMPDGMMLIKPDARAEAVTITVKSTDKKVKFEEKTVITIKKDSVTMTPDKKTYETYITDDIERTLSFTLSDEVTVSEGKTAKVCLVPEDSYYSAKPEKMEAIVSLYSCLENNLETSIEGKNVKTSGYMLDGSGYIPAGTYTFYAALCEGVQKDKRFDVSKTLTQPVKVTIKVKNVPKPSATLSPKATIGSVAGSEEKLAFKSKKNVLWLWTKNVFNNSQGGKVNNFAKYFYVDSDDENIILYRKDTPIDDKDVTIVKVKGKEVRTITGWIGYDIVGLDDDTIVHKCEKITVTLE